MQSSSYGIYNPLSMPSALAVMKGLAVREYMYIGKF